MKKILIIFAILFCFAQISFAAGSSMTFVRTDVVTHTGERWVEFVVTCTADDTNGSFPDTQIPGNLAGYKLFSISTYFGSPAPTIDSDLTITDASVAGEDVLGGAGIDKIDATTNNFFRALVGSDAVELPIFRSLWMQIDNNSVNDAVTTVTLKLIQ